MNFIFFKNTKTIIAILLITLAAIALFIFSGDFFSNRPINTNLFIDSSDRGKFIFAFYATYDFDTDELTSIGKQLFNDNKSWKFKKTMPIVVVAHFYSKNNTHKLGTKEIAKLKKQYPHLLAAKDKLLVDNDGYIFTAISSTNDSTKYYKDTLYPAQVIVPIEGVRANEILKKDHDHK